MRLQRLLFLGGIAALTACAETTAPNAAPPAAPGANEIARNEVTSGPVQVMRLSEGLLSADGAETGAAPGARATSPILYHKGPILATPKVVAVYWSASTLYAGGPAAGTKGVASGDHSLVGYFLSNLGASSYWAINNPYTQASGAHVGNLTYTGFWANNVSVPGAGVLTDAKMQAMLISGFNGGKIGYDANTIYAIFTGHGVNAGGGFGSQYCAYHGPFTWSGKTVLYSVQPYNADFYNGCSAGLTPTPNADRPADVEVNTLAHELEESATDPRLNAWYDAAGNENADKCAWTWGTTYKTTTNATANIKVGTKDFLIQRNWRVNTQACAKS